MEHIISKLLRDFEEGKMSRRQLVQSLALAATAAAGVAPADAAGTGFKAVTVNHISYQCADYAKTRDFYADLLGMGIKEDNGRQCYMPFGETFLLPRTRRTPPPNQDAATQKKGNRPPRPPVTALVDHIAYTIEDWDQEKVKAELEKRGLNPREDTKDSYHIYDPDGFDLQISGKNMKA